MTATTGRQYWERHAKRYDRSTRFLSRPVPRMLELAVHAARGQHRVLEVAAGTGLVTTAIGPVVGKLVATDYAEEMVRRLADRVRDTPHISCEAVDLYALPYPAGSYDAVVAANVLHLVTDLPSALAGLKAVLKPGGLLVVPTYLHAETISASILSRVLALTGFPGQRRLTAVSLAAAVEAAGFDVVRQETIPGPIPIGYVEARC